MWTAILLYSLLILFFGLILVFWGINFIGLPGNWLMIFSAVIWNSFGPETFRFSWIVVVALVALAGVGELLEFIASVFGTKKMGGSNRGATWSVIGSIIGGILGVFVGFPIPIPVVGMMISGILFASIGAMAGAMWGEYRMGTPLEQNMKIGGAAFVGRMLGTFGKILAGAVMVAILGLAPWVF